MNKTHAKFLELFTWFNDCALPNHTVAKERLPDFFTADINFIINEKQIATNIEQLYQHLSKLFNNENGTVHFDPPLDIIQTDNIVVLRYVGYIYGSKNGDVKIYDMGIFRLRDNKIAEWKAVISAPLPCK